MRVKSGRMSEQERATERERERTTVTGAKKLLQNNFMASQGLGPGQSITTSAGKARGAGLDGNKDKQ